MDPAQHVLHVEAATGEVGDFVQGQLQPLVATQRFDPLLGHLQQAQQFLAAEGVTAVPRVIHALRQLHDPAPVHGHEHTAKYAGPCNHRQPLSPAIDVRRGMPCTHALAARLPAPFPAPPAIRRLAPVDGPDASDEALMLAYAAGEATAFEQLYARHRGKLYRYLLRQLRDNGLADELFQDIWRSLKHRPAAPADADERTARLADPDTPERVLSEFERRRQLQLALDDLPGEQREVLLLRLEQELTLEEIGEVTGVGRETVKSRLRYAMDKLRAVMPA